MKKKILALLLFMAFSALLIVSCGKSGDGTEAGGEETVDAVVKNGQAVSLIYDPAECDEDLVLELYSILSDKIGGAPEAGLDASIAKGKHEIVIGESKRDITAEAKNKLSASLKRAIRASYDEDEALADLVGYAVYSDGDSIAVVWSDDYVADAALEYFIDNYFVSDTLAPEAGYVKTEVFSLVGFLAARGDERREAQWVELEAYLGEGSESLVAALKELYVLFDEDLMDWYANLYDPAVGGFYCANSARDNVGFLPDAESTVGILEMISAYGMTGNINDNYADFTPEWLNEQVINFIYNLQDPDGYFYLPQWGKDVYNSRRARDLDVCTRMLKAYGVTPKYTPATASYGVGLWERDSERASAVVLASASTTVPQPYQSVEQYTEYVKEMVVDDAYTLGNFLQSGYPEIVKYGRLHGADLLGMTFEILEEAQNPETGVWADEPGWYATNGLHKISSFYNKAGREFPNAEAAAETVLDTLELGLESTQCVEAYNAWSCFGYLYSNIRRCGDATGAEREERAQAIIAKVREMAPSAIIASKDIMLTFAKPDGSYSYFVKFSASTMQGARACVPSTVEGDVNGTGTAYALVEYIFSALGLEDYFVAPYDESDMVKFYRTLEGLGTVVKHVEAVEDPQTYDFEDCQNETDYPAEFRYDQRNGEFYIETDESGNKYLQIDGRDWYTIEGWETNKRNPYFSANPTLVHETPNVGVISLDIEFERINPGRAASINFSSILNEQITCIWFNGVSEGRYSYVRLQDAKFNDLGVKIPMNTEVNLRAEYYFNEGIIKVFLNGEYLAETDEILKPEAKFGDGGLSVEGNGDVRFKVDNVVIERNYIRYRQEEEGAPPTFPEPIMGKPFYDFEDCTVGGDFPIDFLVTKNDGTAAVAGDGTGKHLHVTGTDFYYNDSETLGETNWDTKKRNPIVAMFAHPVAANGNAYALEFDLTVNSASIQAPAGNAVMRLSFIDALDKNIMQFNIRYRTSGARTEIFITDNAKTSVELLSFKAGDTVKLRFEYFPDEGKTKIYLGGIYVALADNGAETLPRKMTLGVETGANIDYTLDNAFFNKITADFGDDEPTPVVPEGEKPLYDFEDSVAIPDGITANPMNGTAEVLTKNDNNYLHLLGKDRYYDPENPTTPNWGTKDRNPNFTLRSYTVTEDGNAYVLKLELTVNSASIQSGAGAGILRITFNDAAASQLKAFLLLYHVEDGETQLQLVDGARTGTTLYEFKAGDTVSLKFVCLTDTGRIEIFSGESFVTELSGTQSLIANAFIGIETAANTDIEIDNIGLTRENATATGNTGSGDGNTGSGDGNTDSGDDNTGSGDGNTGSGDGNTGSGDDNTGSGDDNTGSGDGNTDSGDDNTGNTGGNFGTLPDGISASEPTGNPLDNGAGVTVVTEDGEEYIKYTARDRYYNYSTGIVDWDLPGRNPVITLTAQNVGEAAAFEFSFDLTIDSFISYSNSYSTNHNSTNGALSIQFCNGYTEDADGNPVDNVLRKLNISPSAKGVDGAYIVDNIYANSNPIADGEKISFKFYAEGGRMYVTMGETDLGSWGLAGGLNTVTHIVITPAGGLHADMTFENIVLANK